MDLEQFDYTDMYFRYYEDGFFVFEGVHEGYKIMSKFKPNKNFKGKIYPLEIFKDIGWSWIKITDEKDNVIYEFK